MRKNPPRRRLFFAPAPLYPNYNQQQPMFNNPAFQQHQPVYNNPGAFHQQQWGVNQWNQQHVGHGGY